MKSGDLNVLEDRLKSIDQPGFVLEAAAKNGMYEFVAEVMAERTTVRLNKNTSIDRSNAKSLWDLETVQDMASKGQNAFGPTPNNFPTKDDLSSLRDKQNIDIARIQEKTLQIMQGQLRALARNPVPSQSQLTDVERILAAVPTEHLDVFLGNGDIPTSDADKALYKNAHFNNHSITAIAALHGKSDIVQAIASNQNVNLDLSHTHKSKLGTITESILSKYGNRLSKDARTSLEVNFNNQTLPTKMSIPNVLKQIKTR